MDLSEMTERWIVFGASDTVSWRFPLKVAEGGALWIWGNRDGSYEATIFPTRKAAELAVARSLVYAADNKLNWPCDYDIRQIDGAIVEELVTA